MSKNKKTETESNEEKKHPTAKDAPATDIKPGSRLFLMLGGSDKVRRIADIVEATVENRRVSLKGEWRFLCVYSLNGKTERESFGTNDLTFDKGFALSCVLKNAKSNKAKYDAEMARIKGEMQEDADTLGKIDAVIAAEKKNPTVLKSIKELVQRKSVYQGADGKLYETAHEAAATFNGA